MASAVVQQNNTSAIPIRLSSTDVPQTLQEGIDALTTDTTQRITFDTGAPAGTQEVGGASVIVSAASILISVGRGVPTFASLISTTLANATLIAATNDLGVQTSSVTKRVANHVKLAVTSSTGIQAGMKITISGTTNYDKTFFVEDIPSAGFITIESAFFVETVTTADTVISPDVGILVAAGEIYELTSSDDVRNFRYVSAAATVIGTMNLDLKFGG